jgi:hypothetical protein
MLVAVYVLVERSFCEVDWNFPSTIYVEQCSSNVIVSRSKFVPSYSKIITVH